MRTTLLESRLKAKIEEKLPGAAPGLQLQVHQGGRKFCDISVGDTYPYYDLASLTKIIFTVPALMLAFEKGLWQLDSRVTDFWPDFPHRDVTLVQILSHSSGALWWHPFYKDLDLLSSVEVRRAQVKEIIKTLPFEARDASVYSDIGFLILGICLEEMEQKSLLDIWKAQKHLLYPGLSTLDFHPDNKSPQPSRFYAPTERDPWRGRLIQGECHDENAFALGGVSSHAGLFSSIDDVSWYGLFLRSQLLGISKTSFKLKTARIFTTRARPLGRGDWALGFMMPTPGSASCGDYFSPYSVGHLGFTGTSIWYDPHPDLLVVLLSNRVLLGREVHEFKKLRPMIHNWVVEELKRI